MQPNEVPQSLVEQGAVRAAVGLLDASWLVLEDFCGNLSAIIHLPDFVYDGENVYQWSFAQIENGFVEINISCLKEPDPSEPVEYTICLMISKNALVELDKSWLEQNLLPDVEAALRLLRERKL